MLSHHQQFNAAHYLLHRHLPEGGVAGRRPGADAGRRPRADLRRGGRGGREGRGRPPRARRPSRAARAHVLLGRGRAVHRDPRGDADRRGRRAGLDDAARAGAREARRRLARDGAAVLAGVRRGDARGRGARGLARPHRRRRHHRRRPGGRPRPARRLPRPHPRLDRPRRRGLRARRRPVPHLGRVARPLALHQRHHRHAEGGDAPARRHPHRLRDLRRAGPRHPPRRRLLLGGQALLRLRHRELDVLPDGGRRLGGALARPALPGGDRRGARRAPGHAVLRQPLGLRPAARQRPSRRCLRGACAAGSARGRPCRPGWSSGCATASASRCSTASAPPRRCTSTCRTGPARSRPGPPGCPCPATRWRSATTTARSSPTGRRARSTLRADSLCTGYWCRTDVNRRVFEGEWMRTGDTYVRNPDGTYRAWAAPTTSSRSAASGSRRWRSRSG